MITLKYLGITIPIKRSVDNQTVLRVNFENTFAQINTVLNMWKTRGLTLMGKVTIIKYLILPKLVYKIMAIPINIEKTVFKFIWGFRWLRISRRRLCALFVEGETNTIDLNSFALALRQKRAKCLLNMNYAALWKEIETLFLSNITIWCLFLTNLKAKHKVLNKLISCRALRATLRDFDEFKHRLTSKQTQNTLNHNLLWLNKSVLYKRQPLLEQEFVDAGIIYLLQLVGPNNDFLSYDELAKKFKLMPNNVFFINFIKMKAEIPHSWETNSNTIVKKICRCRWKIFMKYIFVKAGLLNRHINLF